MGEQKYDGKIYIINEEKMRNILDGKKIKKK